MTEFTPENGQAETLLTEAFAWLKDLHHRDNGDQSDALRSTERIITLLGSTTRELLEVFEQNIRLAAIVDKKEMPSQEAITAMVRERALKIIYHHYEYSGQNPIKSLKYGSFLTEQYLEECVRDGGGEKSLHSFGLVMLDVDGLKAVKECIGHKGTNIFLKKLTKVLTDPESPTNVWMRETEGLEITPIVAGGDEFVLIINSAKPIDAVLMQEIIDRYESDVTSSAELQAMIDFDDPVILLNYAG
ncbi:diguanylate cyclase, partial [Candidatus Peregrinibacteria bacterium]|nr:diguanylate cyclase [Candidatus Peregrinibacteria bacterium]